MVLQPPSNKHPTSPPDYNDLSFNFHVQLQEPLSTSTNKFNMARRTRRQEQSRARKQQKGPDATAAQARNNMAATPRVAPSHAPGDGILGLPVELILDICDRLPPHSRYVLQHVCRAFRAALGRAKCPQQYISAMEYVHYLAAICHDMPRWWVCDRCLQLHEFNVSNTALYDVPSNSVSACPKPPCSPAQSAASPGTNGLLVHHRHVQACLKYFRLRPKDQPLQEYVRAVLAPFTQRYPNEKYPCGKITYSAYPKIVDGRFLVYSKWVYEGDRMGFRGSPASYGAFDICQHECWIRNLSGRASLTDNNNVFPLASDNSRRVRHPITRRATYRFLPPGQRRGSMCEGSCWKCATDCCIGIDGRTVIVMAWYDLGPERSCTEPGWMALISRGARFRDQPHGRTVSCQSSFVAGNVRRLYERGGVGSRS